MVHMESLRKSFFSFPVRCENGEYHIVQGLDVPESSQSRLQTTLDELLEERELAREIVTAQH